MDVLEKYNQALNERAGRMREQAALASDDQRQRSLYLMQASMLGDMLRQLGRVDHEKKRPGALQGIADQLEAQASKQEERGDYDAADQTRVKAATVRWALETLRGLEEEHE